MFPDARQDGEFFVAATYNVHQWRGVDGRFDQGRVIEVILEIQPDVIALQEACFGLVAGETGLRKRLENSTGLRAVAGMTCSRDGQAFGNLLLIRPEISSVELLDLSFRKREPRCLVDARLKVDGGAVRVLAAHLGLSLAERRFQVGRIIEHIGAVRPDPVILMGDFNAWLPATPWLKLLDRTLGRSPRPATFPSWAPFLPLDRIWISPERIRARYRVHKTETSRAASDHLPLVARLKPADLLNREDFGGVS